MTKIERETHHFLVLNGAYWLVLRSWVGELISERCQNLTDKLMIMKSLPWEDLGREFVQGNQARIRETIQDYLDLLLEKDPWVLRNLGR
jgi:hypothetical protein